MKGVRICANMLHREQVELPDDPKKELEDAGFECVGALLKHPMLYVACSTITPPDLGFIVLPESRFGSTYICFGDVVLWYEQDDLAVEDTVYTYKIFNAKLPDDVHYSDLLQRKLVYRCWRCGATGLEIDMIGNPIRCAECGAPVDAKGKSMVEHTLEHIQNINPLNCYIVPQSVRDKIEKGEIR
jgi:DNA-directed RNA polymerase subunit RPC12/RpoP